MNILVTAIGSFSADCVINTLKKSGHVVIGCDIYPSEWHAVSKDCDCVYQVPLAIQKSEYIDNLITICKKHNVEMIFPLTDLEIDVLIINRKISENNDIMLCIQSSGCLEIARNKYKMYCLFKDDSVVNVPRTVRPCDLSDNFPLPAIAKPVNGRSSEGLKRINSSEELVELKKNDNYIIQKLLDGNVFTVDYVRDALTGYDFAIPREELLRTKNGAGTTVRIVNNDTLREISSYIGKKIGVNGCINMEFICCANTYYLIDINPRFSAGVAFSNFVGYDMVTAHLNCFINTGRLPVPINYREQLICKRYKEEQL